MLFCSLVAFINSALMLSLLADDLTCRKARPEPRDYLTDAFLIVSFACALILAGHGLFISVFS